ncbi:MAG TPA: DUF4157 domain-containing protein [Pyrinomonadaceae bacterium]|nr:DUF4157 domain-containing protein [Pyrinomonadaceae bacterium]
MLAICQKHFAVNKREERRKGLKNPSAPNHLQTTRISGPPIQRKAQCACGGDCPRCRDEFYIQTKLKLSVPEDESEVEADRIADQVMQMSYGSAGAQVGRFTGKAASNVMRSSRAACEGAHGDPSSVVARGTSGGGRPLDSSTRVFMESRFGRGFSHVRLHTDGAAAESARTLNAHAYTLGNNIVFGAGRYQPQTEEGRRLVAHELTHVLQQGGMQAATLVQRECADDPTFCTPYSTPAESAFIKALLRSYYLPTEGLTFGSNSRGLYEMYLSRHPGDSLAPVEFNTPGSDVVESFAGSGDTADDQDAIIDLIGARLSRAPSPLQDNVPTMMSVENFLSRSELDNRPINYSNPLSIAGHIAGGIGSSDAGPDYRKVLWGNVMLEKTPLIGSTGYVRVETTLHYEVFDAVDFCPGDCGSKAEQNITVPMSRLEASGEAYDVPFKVTFVPESRSKRFFYS